MIEKIPDFVRRVEEKFKPVFNSRMELPRNKENIKRLEALGVNISDRTFQLGSLNGKPVEWNYNDYEAVYFPKKAVSDSRYVQWFGIKEWTHCRDFYTKEYESKKEKFESKNPVYQQLKALDLPEVKAAMSKDEQKAMRNLYEAKLKKDPDYRDLQDLKRDVFDLVTYVKYLEKKEKNGERRDLKSRLESLKTEYDSTEIKEALPDEKRRLNVRGTMHKIVKKEAGM